MTKKTYIYIVGIALVGAMVGTICYRAGYRVGSFGIGRVGMVEMTLPLIHTNIFIDASRKIETTQDDETVSIPLSPTRHSVIVSRPGYFPWEKKFSIKSGEKIRLEPILVLQNATGQIITQNDPDYWNIRGMVIGAVLPAKEKPRQSLDSTVTMWVEDNIILMKDNDAVHTIIAPEETIQYADFYKGRPDAILFAAGTHVFVIETDTDPSHVQNIFPVFTGIAPRFVETDPGYIYVLDGKNLMAVVI